MFKKSIIISLSFILFFCENKKIELPIYGIPIVNSKTLENGSISYDTLDHMIQNFKLFNQNGKIITNETLKHKIYIADFFFTSCSTICPLMTKNMKYVDSSLRNFSKHISLLSFTINPDFDTPKVLRRYRSKYKISSKNWLFLRGNEKQTHQLGIEHFKVFATRDENVSDGFAHSGAFTLVDKEGFVRGVYLGTDKKEVDKLIKDVKLLLNKEYNVN